MRQGLLEKLPPSYIWWQIFRLSLLLNHTGRQGFICQIGALRWQKLASAEILSALNGAVYMREQVRRHDWSPGIYSGSCWSVWCVGPRWGVISFAFILAAATFMTAAGLNHVSGCFLHSLPSPFHCESRYNVCSTFSASFNFPFFPFDAIFLISITNAPSLLSSKILQGESPPQFILSCPVYSSAQIANHS